MIPGCSSVPIIVNVLPLAVWPYANTVPENKGGRRREKGREEREGEGGGDRRRGGREEKMKGEGETGENGGDKMGRKMKG